MRAAPRVSAARAVPRIATARLFQTSSVAAELKKRFTAEHEWIVYDTEANVATMGITDHAQNSLGEVVFVELPEQNTEVNVGEQIGFAESIKAVSDIYAPVSGIVTEVNAALREDNSLLNKSAEDQGASSLLTKGWLAKIQLSRPSEFDELLSEEAYKELLE